MRYLSCFSGIGGLEADQKPIALCEIDPQCQAVLRKEYPRVRIFHDAKDIDNIRADVIAGGWPCQDISVAGKKRGLAGKNSGLFYAFVKAAKAIRAHTIVAENVPNLLTLDNGKVFTEVIREFVESGYKYCSWRVLNARQLGLPHNRARVFIIASRSRKYCTSLFRPLPPITHAINDIRSAGFYWTAGTQSLCYSVGYVPTIKVGSSLSIPSPPAVHYGSIVRMLTAQEALRLQGFDAVLFNDIPDNALFRMAGNAVAVPVGKFVMNGVLQETYYDEIDFEYRQTGLFSALNHHDDIDEVVPKNGMFDGSIKTVSVKKSKHLATNLSDFLDLSSDKTLSKRAAAGLLRRLERSGARCPEDLRAALGKLAGE